MINRSDIQTLIKYIEQRPKEIDKLNMKEKAFFYGISDSSKHYGYLFSEKQYKWLQSIYRKVYKNC